MNAERFESFLARLYTDERLRARFLRDPRGVAAAEHLSPAQVEALAAIDRAGLVLASESLARKRKPHASLWQRVLRSVRRSEA